MAYQGGSLQLGPWTGGVIYNRPAEDLTANELSSMRNCRINAAGAVEKRKGFASYESAAAIAGTPTVTGVHEYYYTSSSAYTVITAGAKIYYYNSGWSDITGALTITAGDDNNFKFVTTGEKASGNNRMVATNGIDAPIVWGGSGNAAALNLDGRFTTAKSVAWWDNRLWLANTNANDNRIWRSDILDIETWGASNYYNVGEEITALVPMQNSLAIHTRNGIYTLTPTGNAAIPFQLQQRTQAGTVASRACLTLPNERQIFVRPDGVYMWSGSEEITKISYALDDGFWPDLNNGRLEYIHAVYYPSVNEVWFFIPTAASTNMDNCIIYNERFDIWFGPYTGFQRGCSALVDETPHAGGFDGKLYNMVSSVYNDAGSSIQATFVTGAPAPVGGDVRLRWLYSRTYFDQTGDYNLLIQQESGGLVATSNNLNLQTAGFQLDLSQLDLDRLGSLRMVSADTDMTGYDAQCSLQFVNNNANEYFRIRRTHLVYRPVGRVRKASAGVS